MKDADAASRAARSADAAAVNVQIVKDNLQQVLNMARDCGMVVDPVSGDVRPAVPGVGPAERLEQRARCCKRR